MTRKNLNRRTTTALKGLACFAAALTLVVPAIAQAVPSDEDIARAKAEVEAAKLSVSQIEVELANATARFDAAVQASQIASEAYNKARVELEEKTQAAEKAQADADKAQADFDQGKRELASVVQAAYRDGGSALDSLTPYLESDGLRTVEIKQSSIDTFGSAAEKKMQRVAALEQVAKVMKDAADKAVVAKQEAADDAEAKLVEAKTASENAEKQKNETEARRTALIEELAQKENTTADLIRQREEELERQRQEAARQEAARRAQQAAAAQAASSSSSGGGGSYTPAPSVPISTSPGNTDAAAGAIAYAKSLLGSPYVWAGEGPGYDCSGLVTVSYRTQGIYLEHWSVAQYRYGASGGSYVPIGSAQPGDLVFWSSNGSASGVYHVAIYLGGNQIIEAPTFGVPVRITSMYSWGNVMPYAVRVV